MLPPKILNPWLKLFQILSRYAVSYTHLDVYKRQVQCIINECEQIKRENEIQENINDEFRSNFEQVDAIKINVRCV